MNRLKRNTQAGFTLMEILVVMVIIGILVSIGINSLIGSQKKGRDARRKEDLHQISTALEVFYNDTGSYPESTAQGKIIGCGTVAIPTPCDWGTIFNFENNTYMVQLPADPVEGYQYFYESVAHTDALGNDYSAGEYYRIYARLENEQDKDLELTDEDVVKVYEDTVCVTSGSEVECNYGIGSTNQIMPAPEEL